jgi:hypothetical protein
VEPLRKLGVSILMWFTYIGVWGYRIQDKDKKRISNQLLCPAPESNRALPVDFGDGDIHRHWRRRTTTRTGLGMVDVDVVCV